MTVVTSRYDRSLPVEEETEGYRILRTRTLGVLLDTPLDTGTRRTVRALAPDVFHLHYPPPLTSYFTTRDMRHRKVQVCLTYHCDLYLPGVAGRLLSGIYQRVFLPSTLDRTDGMIVHTKSYGGTSAMLRGRKLNVIPSAVDLDRFRPGIDAGGLRSDLRLDGKQSRCSRGDWFRTRAWMSFFRLSLGCRRTSSWSSSAPDLACRAYVGLARRLGVDDRVRFCPAVSDENLPRYLGLGDVFVFPSQNRLEGFGLAVAEAMAVGLPVVIADMPGVREVIEPGREGLLAEPLLAGDLAEKIQKILDDPELAKRMGRAGRQRAEARYALPVVAQSLVSLYEALRAAG